LAVGKFNDIRSISSGFCNGNVRMRLSGEKSTYKAVKQNIFSRLHTLKPVSISLPDTVGCVPSATQFVQSAMQLRVQQKEHE